MLAERLVAEGKEKGMWIYLQNCHLYVSWMDALERLCAIPEAEFTAALDAT